MVASAAMAEQAANPLKLTNETFLVKLVKQGDKVVEQLERNPAKVKPGDVLVFQTTATNTTKEGLQNVALRMPIPEGVAYQAKSATPTDKRWKLEFSFDKGKTYGTEVLKRKMTVTENGKTLVKEVVVKPEEYTNTRWTISSVQPEEELKFSIRVKVK